MSERQRHRMPSTVFILLRAGDTFCAIQRAHTGWMDGHHSLPAGAVEADEALLDAAVREAHEEVGVRVQPGDFRLVHTLHCRTRGEAWLGHFFSAERWAGTPSICEPHKHADLRWMRFDDIQEPFVPYVKAALQGIARGEAYSTSGLDA